MPARWLEQIILTRRNWPANNPSIAAVHVRRVKQGCMSARKFAALARSRS